MLTPSFRLHVFHLVRIPMASRVIFDHRKWANRIQVLVYLLAHCGDTHVHGNHDLNVHLSVCFEHLRCADAIQLLRKHCSKPCEPSGHVFIESVCELHRRFRRFSCYCGRWKRSVTNVGSRRCHRYRYDVVCGTDRGGGSLAIAKRFARE